MAARAPSGSGRGPRRRDYGPGERRRRASPALCRSAPRRRQPGPRVTARDRTAQVAHALQARARREAATDALELVCRPLRSSTRPSAPPWAARRCWLRWSSRSHARCRVDGGGSPLDGQDDGALQERQGGNDLGQEASAGDVEWPFAEARRRIPTRLEGGCRRARAVPTPSRPCRVTAAGRSYAPSAGEPVPPTSARGAWGYGWDDGALAVVEVAGGLLR